MVRQFNRVTEICVKLTPVAMETKILEISTQNLP